jgi:hypothetical protein
VAALAAAAAAAEQQGYIVFVFNRCGTLTEAAVVLEALGALSTAMHAAHQQPHGVAALPQQMLFNTWSRGLSYQIAAACIKRSTACIWRASLFLNKKLNKKLNKSQWLQWQSSACRQ